MKRPVGRPVGSKTGGRTSAYKGSFNSVLEQLHVGGYLYIEANDLNASRKLLSRVTQPVGRRPDSLKSRTFSGTTFTAVAAKQAGDVKLLVRIERTS